MADQESLNEAINNYYKLKESYEIGRFLLLNECMNLSL